MQLEAVVGQMLHKRVYGYRWGIIGSRLDNIASRLIGLENDLSITLSNQLRRGEVLVKAEEMHVNSDGKNTPRETWGEAYNDGNKIFELWQLVDAWQSCQHKLKW